MAIFDQIARSRIFGGVIAGPIVALGACIAVPAQSAAPAPAPASAPMTFSPFMVAISVADMEAETAWYVEKLDFKVVNTSTIGGGTQIRWLMNGTQRIELIGAPGSAPGPQRLPPPRHAGIRGLSQVTLETNDLVAVRDRLVARGVTPTLDITDVVPLGIKVIYIVDPEGNAVEIAQKLAG